MLQIFNLQQLLYKLRGLNLRDAFEKYYLLKLLFLILQIPFPCKWKQKQTNSFHYALPICVSMEMDSWLGRESEHQSIIAGREQLKVLQALLGNKKQSSPNHRNIHLLTLDLSRAFWLKKVLACQAAQQAGAAVCDPGPCTTASFFLGLWKLIFLLAPKVLIPVPTYAPEINGGFLRFS